MGGKRYIKGWALFLGGLLLILAASAIAPSRAVSQDVSVPEVIEVDPNTPQTDTDDRQPVPVIVDGATLFSIRQPLGLSTAEERAQQITDRILAVARDSDISLNDFKVVEQAGMAVVYGGPNLIVRVTDADGVAVNVDRQVLANSYLEQIRTAVDRYREERQSGYLTQAILSSLAATLAFIILVIVVCFIFSQIIKSLINWRDRARQRQQKTVFWIFSPQAIGDVSVDFLRTLRSFIIVGLLLLYVPALYRRYRYFRSLR